MNARRAVLLAVAWAGVVLVGSTMVWLVISQVGDEVTGQPTTTAAAPSPRDRPTDPGDEPTRTPRGEQRSPASPETEPSSSSSPVVSDTWSGVPGTVRVSCRGSRVTDWSASPDVGWYLESEDEGQGVTAKFEQEGEGREVEVEATCTAEGPVFSAKDGS